MLDHSHCHVWHHIISVTSLPHVYGISLVSFVIFLMSMCDITSIVWHHSHCYLWHHGCVNFEITPIVCVWYHSHHYGWCDTLSCVTSRHLCVWQHPYSVSHHTSCVWHQPYLAYDTATIIMCDVTANAMYVITPIDCDNTLRVCLSLQQCVCDFVLTLRLTSLQYLCVAAHAFLAIT